jgi:DNA-directed RNA polymerase specialized sigma24 family protein
MNRQLKNHVSHEPLDDLEIAGEGPTDISLLGDVRSLLSVLSLREEEVLLLRLEAFKYREIAEQLGISMNSVNTLLARALRKLQQATVQQPARQEREKANADTQNIRAS